MHLVIHVLECLNPDSSHLCSKELPTYVEGIVLVDCGRKSINSVLKPNVIYISDFEVTYCLHVLIEKHIQQLFIF